jgi:hypothetical protein
MDLAFTKAADAQAAAPVDFTDAGLELTQTNPEPSWDRV